MYVEGQVSTFNTIENLSARTAVKPYLFQNTVDIDMSFDVIIKIE